MQEFMFFIRKKGNSQDTLSADKHRQFLEACESYIHHLKQHGKLISAQPMDWSGVIVSGKGSTWKHDSYEHAGEVIGGHYHILAANLDEAIEIAKANPEFSFNEGSRIEVRPVKTKEETTGFVYPTKKS